jgi:sulfite exporter TauE/SafE
MFLSAFILGLTGSLHCIGMCGPIAMMIQGKNSNQLIVNRVLYNLGRTITYVTMGIVVGFFGKIIQWGGLQGKISIALGLLIFLILFIPTIQKFFLPSLSQLVLKLKNAFATHLQSRRPFSSTITGMLNGFLPCGLVYAGLAIALIQNTPWESAAVMALFGLGTIPMLIVAAYSWQAVKSAIPFSSAKLQTAMLVIVAVVMIWRGVSAEMNLHNGHPVTECNTHAYYSEAEDQ